MNLNSGFSKILADFVEKNDGNSMDTMIAYAKSGSMSIHDTALLTERLAYSGKVLRLSDYFDLYDIPSTGGPGSLSTLLTPLLLRCKSKKVAKLGVPGRPAGGIDVLAQIPGYQISPDFSSLMRVLNVGGYVHVIANQDYTPLDKLFFDYRKLTGNLNIPELVCASILSKKLAFDVKHVGLDIRVWNYGNFGNTVESARKNSELFIEVSKLLGIQAECYLNDNNVLQQPFIGRGESLLALHKIFSNDMDQALDEHLQMCNRMVQSLVNEYLISDISFGDLGFYFFENVKLQGGIVSRYHSLVEQIQEEHIHQIAAVETGYLNIDVMQLRNIINIIQGKYDLRFADPCGVIFRKMNGEYVKNGDIICTFRCPPVHIHPFQNALHNCLLITDIQTKPHHFEVVK
jgi:thymidine phosphorylase